MPGLRKMLLQEQERLEKILQKTLRQLEDVPLGTLRLSNSKKWVQFYHCLPDGKKNGEYIPKGNEKLVKKLAQKSYDEKIQKLAEKRLAQIKRITRDYDDDEIEKIFLDEHKERRKLIEPVEPAWESSLADWMSEGYKKKEFQEGLPVILCL